MGNQAIYLMSMSSNLFYWQNCLLFLFFLFSGLFADTSCTYILLFTSICKLIYFHPITQIVTTDREAPIGMRPSKREDEKVW